MPFSLNGRPSLQKASAPKSLPTDPFAIMKFKPNPNVVRRRSTVVKQPETRSRAFDVLCFFLLVIVACLSFALWKAPAHGLVAKVHFINAQRLHAVESGSSQIRGIGGHIREDFQMLRKTLNGELSRDNQQLEAQLASLRANNTKLDGKIGDEKKAESDLKGQKQALGNQLSEARHREEALHRKLVKDEKNLVLTQESMDTARMWQQSWHQKFTDSESRLGKARVEVEHEHIELQTSLEKLDKSGQQKDKLQADLENTRTRVKQLETSERALRGQLEAEREQRRGLADKVHRFKAAELSLMKSLDLSEA
jgi:chromosome segregation ATPase